MIPWLKQRGVALLGSEAAQDVAPQPKGSDIGALPLHDFALIMLGIHLFDNTNLYAVGQTAAERKRWEFLLTAAPLPVRGTLYLTAASHHRINAAGVGPRRHWKSASRQARNHETTKNQRQRKFWFSWFRGSVLVFPVLRDGPRVWNVRAGQ